MTQGIIIQTTVHTVLVHNHPIGLGTGYQQLVDQGYTWQQTCE